MDIRDKNRQKMENFTKKLKGKNISEAKAKSRLNTTGYIEIDQMEATLSDIYHIIAGNRREYLSIPDSLVKELKRYA